GLGFIILMIYLAVRAAVTASAWLSGNRFRAYRTLASRYRGRYESRGLSDPPTVSFEHAGTNVRVGLAPNVPGQALGPRTRVVARFARGIPFRLELAPAARPSPPQPPKGTRLVRVGDADFDRAFVVQANDPEMAQAFLNAPARKAIVSLQRLAPPSGMLLSVNPERLLVQVDKNLALLSDALIQAVHHALVLHDGLIEGVSSRLNQGIEIVENAEAPQEVFGPPICKVCGELILGPAVLCQSCRTPHHRDCWEFVGVCSIYGCGQKQSLPA
ncbi:MAG: RING finger protein, partial [Isosphaeraceae bacterium]